MRLLDSNWTVFRSDSPTSAPTIQTPFPRPLAGKGDHEVVKGRPQTPSLPVTPSAA